MQKRVLRVALRDIVNEEGVISAEGIIAEDVLSESLAVILPAGTSLVKLMHTYPRIMTQLAKHGVTHLKVKDFNKLPPALQDLSLETDNINSLRI